MNLKVPKITVWRAIFAVILLGGLYATYLRVVYGLGGSTNLSDRFPWGVWIGFDVLCGVGLAAGGFTLVAIVQYRALQAHFAPRDPHGVPGL
jgi:Ni/Fe-hydrogenase subunit HybB-like protein